MRYLFLLLALALAACAEPEAQPSPAAPDTSFLEQYAATNRFRLGEPTSITVSPDGKAVYFLRSPNRSFVRDLYVYDVPKKAERVLVTAEKLLGGGSENLSAEERAHRERLRLSTRGIAEYALSRDGKTLLVPLSGKLYVVDPVTASARPLVDDGGYPDSPVLSPDGSRVAVVRQGDVYVIDIASNTQRRLTTTAKEGLQNGLAEFVAQEEMGRFAGLWWSGDSRELAYQETDTSHVERLTIADPARPAEDAERWPYPRPGKENAAVRLGIVSADGGPTRWIAWDSAAFPYLATVVWGPDAPLCVAVENRAQTELSLLEVDPKTQTTRQLLRETDTAWLNLDQSTPRFLPDGSFLWTTERAGGPALEQRGKDGALLRTLTTPGLGYRELLHATPNELFVLGSSDPTEVVAYRLLLKDASGDAPVPSIRLGAETGLQRAWVSEDASTYVLATDLPNGGRRVVVHTVDGDAGTIASATEAPTLVPEIEMALTGTSPALYSALLRPKGYSPDKKYPVVVHVYGGPGVQLVQKAGRGFWLDQWIADQGFVVALIDGRGTPGRGRELERSIKGDLAQIQLADQVAGLQALGAKHPEMDLERVGIYGWSFGGTMAAMAVLRKPEIFKVAVAGAPVTDWLDYDTHYTERYLGMPAENAGAYSASSPITYAKDLSRPLLIIHGTADDNVYFMHSLKLSDALFRAGKPHELMPLVGLTHMVPDPVVTTRLYSRIVSYLQDNLRR